MPQAITTAVVSVDELAREDAWREHPPSDATEPGESEQQILTHHRRNKAETDTHFLAAQGRLCAQMKELDERMSPAGLEGCYESAEMDLQAPPQLLDSAESATALDEPEASHEQRRETHQCLVLLFTLFGTLANCWVFNLGAYDLQGWPGGLVLAVGLGVGAMALGYLIGRAIDVLRRGTWLQQALGIGLGAGYGALLLGAYQALAWFRLAVIEHRVVHLDEVLAQAFDWLPLGDAESWVVIAVGVGLGLALLALGLVDSQPALQERSARRQRRRRHRLAARRIKAIAANWAAHRKQPRVWLQRWRRDKQRFHDACETLRRELAGYEQRVDDINLGYCASRTRYQGINTSLRTTERPRYFGPVKPPFSATELADAARAVLVSEEERYAGYEALAPTLEEAVNAMIKRIFELHKQAGLQTIESLVADPALAQRLTGDIAPIQE